jgi:hypothetical protein
MGKEDLVFKTPRTESDRDVGINNSGIETFSDNTEKSLIREIEQNSTDAPASNKLVSNIIVQYSLLRIKPNEIPDFATYKKAFENELSYWSELNHTDCAAISFFDNALNMLNSSSIPVLKISDYNTTGLKGTTWDDLVKNIGVCYKPAEAGGGFGIGKYAAFAASALRTVFYNSYSEDGQKRFQGVSVLPSFKAENSNHTGEGYFSLSSEGFEPMQGLDGFGKSAARKEVGTDVYVVGFTGDLSTIKDNIIISSINNFFYAVWNNTLEVRINDEILSAKTLESFLDKFKNDSRLDPLVKEYLSVLKSPNKKCDLTLFEKDDIKILVKMDDSFSRRAAVIRKSGIKIFDKGNILGGSGFSEVIIVLGTKANAFFKSLENPAHTTWSPERAKTPYTPKYATSIMKNLFDKARELVKEIRSTTNEQMDADGVSDYLPNSYFQGKKKQIEALTNKIVSERKARRSTKKEPLPSSNETNFGDLDEDGNIYNAELARRDHKTKPNPKPNPLPNNNPYQIPLDNNNVNKNEIKATPQDDGLFKLKRKIPGAELRMIVARKTDCYELRISTEKPLLSGFVSLYISSETKPIVPHITFATFNSKETKFLDNKIAFPNINAGTSIFRFEIEENGQFIFEVSVNEN